ncbi:hypothetical protein AB0L82_43325 [Nocardia sp. NPDC052001]|uniref:hypothetical protein n=1 Tax=Nocardia sp. NPDC052001 TaxID=3154853 RepID=UPI00343C5D4B
MDALNIEKVSKGLGSRQIQVLKELESRERTAELIGRKANSDNWFRISQSWWLAEGKADWASVRRSVRSLDNRGLLECKMVRMRIWQRDPDYAKEHPVVREVLIARLTEAGRAYL